MAEGDAWLVFWAGAAVKKNLRVKLGGVNPQRVVHDRNFLRRAA
jgi:hypothetical protein